MATVPTTAELDIQEQHKNDSMQTSIYVANIVCFSLACIAVVLRFTSRKISKVKHEADDWLVVAGLVRTPCYRSSPA